MNDPFPYGWWLGIRTYRACGFKAVRWTVQNWFKNLRYSIKTIKWFYQRGSRGWADCDWWNMSYYLASVIIPMLKEIKEKKHGVPCALDENFEEAEKKWDIIVDEMIEAFEAAKRIIDDDYYEEVSGDRFDDVGSMDFSTESLNKFLDSIPHSEVLQWVAMSKADQKIFFKKGKLFIKYFFSLWD